MGFVNINEEIESWLESGDISYDKLSDSEYKKVLSVWRSSFETIIEDSNHMYKGERAMYAVEESLPFNGFIFSYTGSKLLPASVSTKNKVYGYRVKRITNLNRQILNLNDAIVCHENFEFSCIYTHEWLSFALPKYYVKGTE